MGKKRGPRRKVVLKAETRHRLNQVRQDITDMLNKAREATGLSGQISAAHNLINRIPGFEYNSFRILTLKLSSRSKGGTPTGTACKIHASITHQDANGILLRHPFSQLLVFRSWWNQQVESVTWKELATDLLEALGLVSPLDVPSAEAASDRVPSTESIAKIAETASPAGDWWKPLDRFVRANQEYSGTLSSICADYVHFAPKVPGSNEVAVPKDGMRYGRMKIALASPAIATFEMHSMERVFKGTNPFSGFVVCHSETLFLIGFDQGLFETSMFAVLRRPPPELMEKGVKLFGLQAGALPLSLAKNGRGFAKPLVLVDYDNWINLWGDGLTPPDDVLNWMAQTGPGFVLELIPNRADDG